MGIPTVLYAILLAIALLITLSPTTDASNAVEAEALNTALLQSDLILRFTERHKLISRLTYFTCKNPLDHKVGGGGGRSTNHFRRAFNVKNHKLIKCLFGEPWKATTAMMTTTTTTTTMSMANEKGALRRRAFIRVVRLDILRHLRSKRQHIGMASDGSSRWLADVLPTEAQRQVVAVDMACGLPSRRFLELASAKMQYNGKYHWLLIEDYALHVTAGIAIGSGSGGNSSGGGGESMEEFMERLNFYMDTEVTLARRTPSGDSYTLYDVWNPGLNYGGRINVMEIGSFKQVDGLQLYEWFRQTSTILRRLNMQHARVRCMVVVTNKNMKGPLMYYLTHPVSGHIDTMNRFNFNLLMAVRDMFNWTFVLQKTSSWGYVKDGRYDGMIGALIRNETDIGGAPIFFWPQRHKWIDAAGRSWSSRPCFIFRHPHNVQKDRIVFLQPFSNDVWILILACGAFTVLALWLLTTIECKLAGHGPVSMIKAKGGMSQPRQQQREDQLSAAINQERDIQQEVEDIVPFTPEPIIGPFLQRCFLRLKNYYNAHRARSKSSKREGLFFESVLFFVGIICQQGLGFSTNYISGRSVVIISLLFSFSIYQFYSASIVGSLLMEKQKTIKTLKDLLDSSLGVGMEDVLYNRDYFLHTNDPVALELYAKKISAPMDKSSSTEENLLLNVSKTSSASNWLDPETGLHRVKLERYAFHVDVAAAYKIIAETFSERDVCDLTEVSLFPPQKTVSIVQKNSPMRKVISYGLRRVTETGILKYHMSVWHSQKPPCVKQIETSDLHVDMDTVSTALMLLLYSYGLALGILIIEIIHSKWRPRLVFK